MPTLAMYRAPKTNSAQSAREPVRVENGTKGQAGLNRNGEARQHNQPENERTLNGY